MSAKVVKITNRLDSIPAEVAAAASKTVESAWTIGALLNEARELCADDASFGAWRRDNITEPLGIAPRTQRMFQSIARTFTRESLPSFLGITTLADVAALPEPKQAVALDYLTEQASDGKRVSVSTGTLVCQRVKEGASIADLRERYEHVGNEEVAGDVQRPERPKLEGPVVIENDTGEVNEQRAAPRRPARDQADDAGDWAKSIRQTLKRLGNGKRQARLGALVAELRAHGLLDVGEGITLGYNAKEGRLEVTK